jgi:hypothetical protein
VLGVWGRSRGGMLNCVLGVFALDKACRQHVQPE